jgi:predicted phage terminase large subunit-like protein
MKPAIIRATSLDAANLRASSVRDCIDAVRYEESLLEFTEAAWPLIEPMGFKPNWHIEAICDHLEAAANWQINRLLINVPPRHMKSLAVNVFLPAWVWAQDPNPDEDPSYRFSIRRNSWRGPGVRFMHLSYDSKLSTRDSLKCRRIIASSWYQRKWGRRVKLRADQNQKTRFDNLCGGHRLATSEGGIITGVGADIIAFDDPHNLQDIGGNSNVKLEATLRFWDEALPARLDDQKHGVFIVIMQRVHENDLSGHILAKEKGWTHLCLPAVYESKHPFPIRTTVKRKSTGEIWTDPRQEGEVLWPERFPREALNRIAKDESMSSHVAVGQLQQRPTAAEGGMFKRNLFSPRQPVGDRFAFIEARKLKVVRAWDLAWTEPAIGNDPDWTVGVLMGVSPEEIYYVLDVFRARLSPGQLEDAVVQMAGIDGPLCRVRLPQDPGAGKFVSYQLAKKLAGYDVFVEREGGFGNKAQRAAPLVAALEHRFVVLAEAKWNQDFIEEFCAFRPDMAHKHDDQVDATCAAFRACVRRPQWTMLAA